MKTKKSPGFISLIDDTLKVHVFYESSDCDFRDNICISITEFCPDGEKVFRSGETNLFITSEQARELGRSLISAADSSENDCGGHADMKTSSGNDK